MLSHSKKSAVRYAQVGQATNNSAIRKVGQMVKNPLFIKKQFKNIYLNKIVQKFLFSILYYNMENNNVFLGKIERAGCYVNNGKYGYFLTCNKKNYKLPEFLLPEEVTLDMAKRIIAYKQKISEQWLEKKENIKNKDESEDEDEDDGEPPKKEMVLTKNKK